MENFVKKWAICLIAILSVSMVSVQESNAMPPAEISFQVFREQLAPYGRWINDRQYGDMWIPEAGPDFQPYASRGHWIVTSYGNTWVSDYSWGWAPFHYGRWHFDDYYGWAWVPGTEWGPAWVNWRSGGGYYGWAPMEPGINIGISINIPLARWVFVPDRYISHPQIYGYYISRPRMGDIYRRTIVINNIYVNNNRRYVYGPGRADIERATRGRVPVYRINDSDKPGRERFDKGSVNIYRPDVDKRYADNNSRNNSPGRDDRDRGSFGDRNTPDRPGNYSNPDRNPGNSSNIIERPSRAQDAINSGNNTPDRGGNANPNQGNVSQDNRTRWQERTADKPQIQRERQPAVTNDYPRRQPQQGNDQDRQREQNRVASPQSREQRPQVQRAQPSQKQPERTNSGGRSSGRPDRKA